MPDHRVLMSTDSAPRARSLRHAFTVDVEEHFQVHALEGVVDRRTWPDHPSRVEKNTERLLRILEDADVRGTFFVLGWVARRTPSIVRRIAGAGHEVASHGMSHRRITVLGPAGFRQDARASRMLLEDVCGRRVRGFRAPSFSLHEDQTWALEILLEEGYEYDSSRMPVRRPGLAPPGQSVRAHRVETPSGSILEIPVAPLQKAGILLPAGGGAYFRHLPYALTSAALRDAEARGRPGLFYIHPWELDPDQPRLPARPLARLRHYGGLSRTAPRLRRLLDEFRFGTMEQVYSMSDGADPDRQDEEGSREPGTAPGFDPISLTGLDAS